MLKENNFEHLFYELAVAARAYPDQGDAATARIQIVLCH